MRITAGILAIFLATTLAAQVPGGPATPGGPGARRIGTPVVPQNVGPVGPRIARPQAPTGPSAAGTAMAGQQMTPAPRAPAGAGTGGNLADTQWFWSAISPARGDASPDRLATALRHLQASPQAGAYSPPRAEALRSLSRLYGPTILRATEGTRVSPALVLSVMSVESAGDAGAVSRAGARGLMQLMPATAARFNVANAFDPHQNIRGGVAYLDWLMRHFNDDPILALAGYNAGEGAVRDNNGVPPYAETRAYVPKVLVAWQVARGLCDTPPARMSDACAFTPDP